MEIQQNNVEPRLCMTVQDMAKELGIGLSAAYQLVNSTGFPSIRFGERKIRIPRDALKEWLTAKATSRT
jgi:excisionase family DNA binding protein